MQFAQTLDGSAPVLKKIPVGITVIRGVPVIAGTAASAGCILPTVSTGANMLGITEDAATYATAQTATFTDPQGYTSIFVNPGALYRASLWGGATQAAVATATVDAATSDGLTINLDGTDFTNPSMDDGFIFGYTGANSGHRRKITTEADGSVVVTVAFPRIDAVGDTYMYGPFCGVWADGDQYVELSTDLTAVRTDVEDNKDHDNFRVVEFELGNSGQDGVNQSNVLLAPYDHAFGAGSL